MLNQILSSLSTPELSFLLLIFLYIRTSLGSILSLYADERMYRLNETICNNCALTVHSGFHKLHFFTHIE